MSDYKFMNKSEVAIIEGTGFVGSRLATLLKKGSIFSSRYDIDLSKKVNIRIYRVVENSEVESD